MAEEMRNRIKPKNINEDKEIKIDLPVEENKKLKKILDKVNSNDELKTLWGMQNINSVKRLGMSDHGEKHVEIVASIALKIGRILFECDVQPNLLKDFDGFCKKDVEVVLVLASLLHDVGMSIQRENHEELSLLVAQRVLDNFLEDFYDIQDKTVMRSEILHAILSHRSGGNPRTIEAGIVRVSDALDMEKGRSRISFKKGNVDIHAVSAAAIESVNIKRGKERYININIEMNNSAGIFQIDELLKRKLENSGITEYVEIEAVVESDIEKSIIHKFKL